MAWYWIFRRDHLKYHPHGIKLYAEKAAALVAAEGLEELKKSESTVYGLLADCKALGRKIRQKWNKLKDLGSAEASFHSPIPPEEYEDLNIRIRRDRWIL